MPTYDYVCDACGHAFEAFQTISEELLRACPKCRKRTLRRLIGTGAGILFKGSGFYETDYKRASRPAGKDGDGGSGTSGGSGDPGGSGSGSSGGASEPKRDDGGAGGSGSGKDAPATRGGTSGGGSDAPGSKGKGKGKGKDEGAGNKGSRGGARSD